MKFWKRLFGNSRSSPSPGICPNCRARPVALNPATGQYFDYCSNKCATAARTTGPNQSGTPPSLCEQCKQRPKFRDGIKLHPYCGQTCARLAASSPPSPFTNPTTLKSTRSTISRSPTTPISPTTLKSARSTVSRTTVLGPICQTPGCLSPVFVDANGIPSKYCKNTHRRWGESGCISCRNAPTNGTSAMCQFCHDRALRMAPVIIEVSEDHESYTSVSTQFQESWRHNTTCPKIQAVYKIVFPAASLNKYNQYLDSVEARGNFVAIHKSRGNENRRWHGTKRKCNIGDRGIKTFCTDSGCSLCCILTTSFDLKYFKGATGWGRFGAGIYTSSTSSKSNDYSRNEGIISNWKALLLNKVVVGKGKKLTQDDTTLTNPPAGYDSVLAEAVPGGSLNYDELVVYDNDAARPSYLVMYEKP